MPRLICRRVGLSARTTRFTTSTFPQNSRRVLQTSSNIRSLPRGRKTLLAAAALSPVAFIQLAEDDKKDDLTGEQHMLEASRAEIKKTVPDDMRGLSRVCRQIVLGIDRWLIEPLATGLRFLHLVVIFVPVVVTLPMIWFGPRRQERDNERAGCLLWYGFLVYSMERAGPAFIKVSHEHGTWPASDTNRRQLGQWAASRSDIFPTELCGIMSSLHSNAPAHSLDETRRIITKAFDGRSFAEIFEEFDEKPLGVGAIAQVYRARLRKDLAAPSGQGLAAGQPANLAQKVRKNVDVLVKSSPQRVPSSYVAIKVLHPKVERMVRRDLFIMSVFARIINAVPTMEWLSLPDEVEQFGEMMRLQLDLRIESANLSLFRDHFKNRTTASFPFPYTDYTTREVLVEEFAQGIPLASFLELGGGCFQQEIAEEGLDAFLHMLLIDNFVHADLHPGNIMVRFYKPGQLDIRIGSRSETSDATAASEVTESVLTRLRKVRHDRKIWLSTLDEIDKEGFRPQLIFIDTGLVTELNTVNRRNFLDLFKAVAEFDGYRAGHLMVERSRQPDSVIDPEVFALRMQHLVLGVKGKTFALGNIKIGDVLSEVLSMVRGHHVRMEGDFANVVISILLLEGIGRSLDPSLDLFKRFLSF